MPIFAVIIFQIFLLAVEKQTLTRSEPDETAMPHQNKQTESLIQYYHRTTMEVSSYISGRLESQSLSLIDLLAPVDLGQVGATTTKRLSNRILSRTRLVCSERKTAPTAPHSFLIRLV